MTAPNKCGFHCIKINNLNVILSQKEILKNVNLHIHCSEITSIIGRNGAGKSTLIKAILGEIPHTGVISFKDVRDNVAKNLQIGYVPQQINIDNNTPTSVYDLFASYITKKPVFLYKDKKVYEKIQKQLGVFGVSSLIDKTVCSLSGGELQRVLLAVATLPTPNLLILDEPVSGVDRNGMQVFYETISDLKDKFDLSIVLISHDLEFVYQYSDRVLLLDQTILEEGPPEKVFRSKAFKDIFGNISYAMGVH